MIRLSRHPRWGIVVVLVGSVALVWFLAPAPAQVVVDRPQDPEKFEMQYWYCGRCHRILGFGEAPPETQRCPSCGSRLEYRDPNAEGESESTGLPAFSLPEINLSGPVLVGVGVTAAVLLVGGLILLLGRNQGPAQDPGHVNE